jgi:hypothetical protein
MIKYVIGKAVPRLRRLVVVLSPRSLRFSLKPVTIGFVADEMAQG